VGAVLTKWFGQRSVPEKPGTSQASEKKNQVVKNFQLELSNMENTPLYDLKHQLSIGSEIGNIVVSDPSVSPRHATFIVQEEVVSVLDHGSVAGTKINGKKIVPGKYIILEESDVVLVGDLEIRLKVKMSSEEATEIPAIPVEPEHGPVRPIKKSPTQQRSPKKSPPAPQVKKKSGPQSANSLVRVMAVIGDLLLSYAVLVVLNPFDEFREVVEGLPAILGSMIDFNWAEMWKGISQNYGFIVEVLEDVYKFLAGVFHAGPLLVVFFLNRLLTTLVLGVSLTEFMVGMRGEGKFIQDRIGGALRVLVGMVTWPFLIFDLPSIISRRTFKEVVTATRTPILSKFAAVNGIILFIPLAFVLSLISPMFQGFESPEAIRIDDRIEQRVKVKGQEEPVLRTAKGSSLGLTLEYNPEELLFIPDIEFKTLRGKLTLQNKLILYQRSLKHFASLEVYKTFDMRKLLGIGMKENIFLYDKYPEIYNFVYEALDANPSFKIVKDEKSEQAFANEFMSFTKLAFGLDGSNYVEVMSTETLLLKGLVDYRASFLSLLGPEKFSKIGFMKMGNLIFMRVEYRSGKPYDLLIPLRRDEGKIFKVAFDDNSRVQDLASTLYKFDLDRSDWITEDNLVVGDTLNALQVHDLFSSPDIRAQLEDPAKAQGFYGFYFEASALVASKNDPKEFELWKERLHEVMKLLETFPSGEEESVMRKLKQNFQDLVDAVDMKNFQYLGVSNVKTV
jgi:hypothetical protein